MLGVGYMGEGRVICLLPAWSVRRDSGDGVAERTEFFTGIILLHLISILSGFLFPTNFYVSGGVGKDGMRRGNIYTRLLITSIKQQARATVLCLSGLEWSRH